MLLGPDDPLIQAVHGGMGASDLHGVLAMADGLNLPPMLLPLSAVSGVNLTYVKTSFLTYACPIRVVPRA